MRRKYGVVHGIKIVASHGVALTAHDRDEIGEQPRLRVQRFSQGRHRGRHRGRRVGTGGAHLHRISG